MWTEGLSRADRPQKKKKKTTGGEQRIAGLKTFALLEPDRCSIQLSSVKCVCTECSSLSEICSAVFCLILLPLFLLQPPSHPSTSPRPPSSPFISELSNAMDAQIPKATTTTAPPPATTTFEHGLPYSSHSFPNPHHRPHPPPPPLTYPPTPPTPPLTRCCVTDGHQDPRSRVWGGEIPGPDTREGRCQGVVFLDPSNPAPGVETLHYRWVVSSPPPGVADLLHGAGRLPAAVYLSIVSPKRNAP